jgi:hypothetical protein
MLVGGFRVSGTAQENQQILLTYLRINDLSKLTNLVVSAFEAPKVIGVFLYPQFFMHFHKGLKVNA